MNRKSIAILPFLNLSSDPDNEYFSDGITEDIINALTRIKELKVTARTSSFAFKDRHVDVRHIGNELGVAAVLEGSVRMAANRVRISAQLIQTTDGFQIWSGRYDRELDDIFELQDDISRAIAEQIRENFGHLEINDQLVDVPTRNIKSYNLYLKARYNHLRWDREGIETAIKLYQKCIEMDPSFSYPYFGLGFSHAMFGSWTPNISSLSLAETYIDKGFEIDDSSFLGYYSRATLEFWGRWNYRKGEYFYRESMRLNPSYTEAEEGLAELYIAIGWLGQAMEHTKHILQLDPLSPNHHFTKANIHYIREEYDSAYKSVEKALAINPAFTHAVALKQLCLIALGREQELDSYLNQTPEAESPETCRLLYKISNDNKRVDVAHIDDLAVSEPFSLMPWPLLMYVQNGNHTKALDILEEAVRNRRGQYANFLNRPFIKPLQSSERFQNLASTTFDLTRLPDRKNGRDINQRESPLENKDEKTLMPPDEVSEFVEKLDMLMNDEQRFLDASLSLRTLAEETGLHPNKLSWLLNDQVGLSFNDYVNTYRLECFKEKAQNPDNQSFTLLGLAFDSGFNSKSTFNTFFKKRTGMTPRSWLKQQRK